jgi:hypothetical protein
MHGTSPYEVIVPPYGGRHGALLKGCRHRITAPWSDNCREAVPFEAHLTPAAEVGWRLARAHWHHGYATEAARQEVTFGSERAGIPEIVSFTNVANVRSQKVMQPLV